LKRCKEHGNCIALIFARTDTKDWHEYIWEGANAILFLKGRLKFCRADGTEGDAAGAPSALVAYGVNNANILRDSKINGKLVWLK
jgi:hypothetical protein